MDKLGVRPMDFEQSLEESRTMKGPIGAASYVALKILAASGADDEQLGQFRIQFNQGLDLLTEDDRMILTYVLDQRVSESQGQGSFSGLVRLVGRLTTVEAHIVHDALIQGGLDTRIRREHQSAADVLHPTDGVELWVRPRNLSAARAILDGLREAKTGTQECPKCNEESPADFGSCWNCTHTFDTPVDAEEQASAD